MGDDSFRLSGLGNPDGLRVFGGLSGDKKASVIPQIGGGIRMVRQLVQPPPSRRVRYPWSPSIDATGDITGAADRLGDTSQTVMQHYAHVLKRKAQHRTETWLTNQLMSP
jgi:hypothetical protein